MVSATPSVSVVGGSSFVGRSDDKAWLATLIASAAGGHGSAEVLSGDIGSGKTSLVMAVLADFPQLPIHVLSGVRTESGFPYGSLQRLVLAHRELLGALPHDQHTALLEASGLARGAGAPQSLIGLGVFSLLGQLTRTVPAGLPLLCLIDDAQWVDPESLAAFAFAGRRLRNEQTVLLFAVRTDVVDPTVLDDFPRHTLAGLPRPDATRLLSQASPHPIDPQVADHIARATCGNPLALMEVPGALTESQLRGGEVLPDPVPIGKHLQAHYLHPVHRLPPDTRLWLLAAAVEPDGNLLTITAASRALGLAEDASRAAEVAGLIHVDTTVTFRHPLLRSAIQGGAPSHDFRVMHEQFAAVAGERGQARRRITHLAAATIGPNDELATELEEAAAVVTRADGYAERTQLLLRSASLTEDTVTRDLRLLAASEAAIAAGSGVQATALLGHIDASRLDDAGRGRLIIAHCELDLAAPTHGPAFSCRAQRLLTAARLFRVTEPNRARQAITSAFWALVQADELVEGTSSREVAEEARRICGARPSAHLPTQALVALSTLVLDGPAAAAPLVGEAARMATTPLVPDEDILQSCICIAFAAGLLHDQVSGAAVMMRAEQIARDCGARLALCRILMLGAHQNVLVGRIREGRERLTTAAELLSSMGLPAGYARMVTALPTVRGWTGNELVTVEDALTIDAKTVGYGMSVSARRIGTMLLRASQARYAEAWAAGSQVKHDDPFYVGALYLPDLIECAAKAGDYPAASCMLQRLKDEERRSESRWAAGLRERSMAHLAAEESAVHFQRALELFAEPGLEMDAARTHLLYGEWLHRRRRRTAAGHHLAEALDTFRGLDAPVWAARADRELTALGEVRAHRERPPASILTAQELAVATLARDGFTNSEIAVRLFVSSNIVDYHLRKVFRKIGVRSRRQLQGIDFDD